ncbi:hypothetical protein Bca4012_042500 [Brassica carinata]
MFVIPENDIRHTIANVAAVKTSHPRSFRHLLHSLPRRILTVRQRSYGSRDLLSFHYLSVRSDVIHTQLQLQTSK